MLPHSLAWMGGPRPGKLNRGNHVRIESDLNRTLNLDLKSNKLFIESCLDSCFSAVFPLNRFIGLSSTPPPYRQPEQSGEGASPSVPFLATRR